MESKSTTPTKSTTKVVKKKINKVGDTKTSTPTKTEIPPVEYNGGK